MKNEDKRIKSFIGKPYFENRHELKYGGSVDSNGLIKKALTKEEAARLISKCPVDKPNLNCAEDLKNWVDEDEGCVIEIIDNVLEFLHDQCMLNEKGESLARGFWEKYIHKG